MHDVFEDVKSGRVQRQKKKMQFKQQMGGSAVMMQYAMGFGVTLLQKGAVWPWPESKKTILIAVHCHFAGSEALNIFQGFQL